jgi:hypothetical protein
MKIKPEFRLKTIAGEHMVIPTGKASTYFNGIITLNESGKLLFEILEHGCTKGTLVHTLIDRYDIDKATAEKDVASFLNTLNEKNVIDKNG